MERPKRKPKFKVGDHVYVPAVDWLDDCVSVGTKKGRIITILITTCGEYDYQLWEDGTNNFHGCYPERNVFLTPARALRKAARTVREEFKRAIAQRRQRVAECGKALEEAQANLRRIRAMKTAFEEQDYGHQQ